MLLPPLYGLCRGKAIPFHLSQYLIGIFLLPQRRAFVFRLQPGMTALNISRCSKKWSLAAFSAETILHIFSVHRKRPLTGVRPPVSGLFPVMRIVPYQRSGAEVRPRGAASFSLSISHSSSPALKL